MSDHVGATAAAGAHPGPPRHPDPLRVAGPHPRPLRAADREVGYSSSTTGPSLGGWMSDSYCCGVANCKDEEEFDSEFHLAIYDLQ
jgi:hypothetical protein